MKLSQLMNPQFKATFNKLMTAKLPAAGLWKVKRIGKWIDKESKTLDESRIDILKKYAKLDDNGELVVDDKGQVEWKEEGSFEGFQKEFNDFLINTDLEVKAKFHFEEIDKAELTAVDLIALDDLIVEPE